MVHTCIFSGVFQHQERYYPGSSLLVASACARSLINSNDSLGKRAAVQVNEISLAHVILCLPPPPQKIVRLKVESSGDMAKLAVLE